MRRAARITAAGALAFLVAAVDTLPAALPD